MMDQILGRNFPLTSYSITTLKDSLEKNPLELFLQQDLAELLESLLKGLFSRREMTTQMMYYPQKQGNLKREYILLAN